MAEQPDNLDTENEFAWPTPNFRLSVAKKIEEAISNVGMSCRKTGVEIENHLYKTSETKDLYMWTVYELVLYMVEMKYGKNPGSGETESDETEEDEESEKDGEDWWTMDDDSTNDEPK